MKMDIKNHLTLLKAKVKEKLKTICASLVIVVLVGSVLFSWHRSNMQKNQALIDLAMRGTPQQVRNAVKQGAKVNARNKDRTTPLIAAARSNNMQVLPILLELGANPKATDRAGRMAIDYVNRPGAPVINTVAVQTLGPSVMSALIKMGADVNTRNRQGETPLMHAGTLEMMNILIQAKADVNAKDETGRTPLIFASYAGTPEMITALVKAGADVNATNEIGQTPLMSAAIRNPNPEVITTLLDLGADPKATDNRGARALEYSRTNESLVSTDAFKRLEQESRWR
ncbi:MAG: ankyrin repeat domain-containing protein [Alphaproteobacteria bacterium]|nr:ankyrin repeat domain-containing protein [Alphaproteobacteria bacterium]